MEESRSEGKITIRFSLMLAIYVALPFTLLLAATDTLFFGSALKHLFPATPDSVALYVVIFNLPHILASFFSFAEPEYVRFYKRRLFIELPIVLGLFLLLGYVAPLYAYALFVGYTIYHIVFQQAGLALLFGTRYSKLFEAWKWTAVLFLAISYLFAYPMEGFFSVSATNLFWLLLAPVVVFAFLSARIGFSLAKGRGRIYFFATALSFLASYFLFGWGYPILSILLLRAVHDLTAFVIYAAHDHNRAKSGGRNLLYGIFSKIGIPIFVLTPIFGIGLAYLFNHSVLQASFVAALVIGVSHYYIESFVWKRDTLHRKQLAWA